MHDSYAFEADGLPTVFIASDAFVQAADVQARALGCTPAAVYVAHPIQDRTDDEMHALAEDAADAIVAALVDGSPREGDR